MMYLFIGEDELSKREAIRSLKRQLFSPEVEAFNYDAFSAKELTVPLCKEAFSRIPVSAKSRLIVIKDMSKLKADVREYIVSQIKNVPALSVVFESGGMLQEEDASLQALLKTAKVTYFKSQEKINAFALARAIERKQAENALCILSDLFHAGEKAERILGALRYQFVTRALNSEDKRRKIRLLLEADNNLKTGRLKAGFALERLIVRLCS